MKAWMERYVIRGMKRTIGRFHGLEFESLEVLM